MPVFDELYRLTNKDLSTAQNVLAKAFFGYPLYSSLFPDQKKQKRFIYGMMGFLLSYGVKYGLAYAPTRAMEGVAIWVPSAYITVPLLRFLRYNGFRVIMNNPLSKILQFQEINNIMERIHHAVIHSPHWYLMAIGVDPEKQKQGFGKKLLIPVLEYLDKQKLPSFLETLSPVNVEIYKKMGFEIKQEAVLPVIGKKGWFMLKA